MLFLQRLPVAVATTAPVQTASAAATVLGHVKPVLVVPEHARPMVSAQRHAKPAEAVPIQRRKRNRPLRAIAARAPAIPTVAGNICGFSLKG